LTKTSRQQCKEEEKKKKGEVNFGFFVVSPFLFHPSTFLHTTHSPSSLTSLYFVVDIHQSPSRSSSISSDLPIAFIIPSTHSPPPQQPAKSNKNNNQQKATKTTTAATATATITTKKLS
jgi:hypothetical protein